MSGDQLSRLKQLEKENERLRRAIADLTLDEQILAESAPGELLSPCRRHQCIEHVRRQFDVSDRRACREPGQHRSTQRDAPAAMETRTRWWLT